MGFLQKKTFFIVLLSDASLSITFKKILMIRKREPITDHLGGREVLCIHIFNPIPFQTPDLKNHFLKNVTDFTLAVGQPLLFKILEFSKLKSS